MATRIKSFNKLAIDNNLMINKIKANGIITIITINGKHDIKDYDFKNHKNCYNSEENQIRSRLYIYNKYIEQYNDCKNNKKYKLCVNKVIDKIIYVSSNLNDSGLLNNLEITKIQKKKKIHTLIKEIKLFLNLKINKSKSKSKQANKQTKNKPKTTQNKTKKHKKTQ
jgi:hypothetical protein